MITFYRDVGKDFEGVTTHYNKLESIQFLISDILQNKEISNIVSNFVYIIYNDLVDIGKRIIGSFSGNSDPKRNLQKTKTFLILFTKQQELFIIDAINGFTHIQK